MRSFWNNRTLSFLLLRRDWNDIKTVKYAMRVTLARANGIRLKVVNNSWDLFLCPDIRPVGLPTVSETLKCNYLFLERAWNRIGTRTWDNK